MQNATVEAVVPAAPPLPVELSERRGTPLAALRRIPEVQQLVDFFVASWHSSAASIQSRRWHRVRFERALLITPLDERTERPAGAALCVTGRDISLTGLSFLHAEPLAPRKVAITIPVGDGTLESFAAVLKWCRFRRDGLYQSGGQFLRSIELDTEGVDVESIGSLRAS